MKNGSEALSAAIIEMLIRLLYFLETDMAHSADSQKTALMLNAMLKVVYKTESK